MHPEKQRITCPKTVLSCTMVLAMLCLPLISHAIELQERAGNWGVHLGASKARYADSGEGLVGGHLELKLAPWLGVQGSLDYHSQATVKVPISTNRAPAELRVRDIPATASARVYLPMPNGLSPFLVGGAGWYHIVYDYSPTLEALGLRDQSHTSFGWHLGAGLRIPLAEKVSIYGEGRYVFLDANRELDQATRQQIGDLNYNSTYISGGLNFHF